MPSTFFSWCALIVGAVLILAGVVMVLRMIWRSSGRRKPPARRPNPVPGLVLPAGRVYVSRAAGAQRARDRVVAPPVVEAGATTHPDWQGRHRMAGAAR